MCGTNLICNTNHKKAHGEVFYLSKRTPRVPPIPRATTETTGTARRCIDVLKNTSKCFQFAFILTDFDLVPSRPTNPQSNYDGAAV